MWEVIVGCNVVIGACYLVIATLITRGLVKTGQLRSNPLALATAAIFVSCAFHHGSHAFHLVYAPGAMAGDMDMMRAMVGQWPYVVIDIVGAIVATTYLSLRRSYGALLAAPAMFSDAADLLNRQLVANLPHTSVFVVDTDLRYVLAGGTGLQSAGHEPTSLVGRHPWEVLAPDAWSELEPHYRGAIEGRTTDFDLTYLTETVFHVRAVPMRDTDGAITGALIMAENITEQRLALARRDEALAYNEAILAASPDATVLVDLSSGDIVWSPRSLSVTFPWLSDPGGGADHELMGLVAPEDLDLVRRDERALLDLPDGENVTTRFCVAAPDGTERWLARRATPFARGEDGVPREALCVLRDVTDMVAAERLLLYAAQHDALTGLPNRPRLVELIAEAQQRHADDGRLALLFCDLDGFKQVNDTHGHEAGDAVLVEVARRMKHVLRGSDSVARVGGDEFVVLLEPPRSPSDTAEAERAGPELLAERIRVAVRWPIRYGEVELDVSVSIGMARVRATDPPDAALRDADAAMYRAKRRGKDRVQRWHEPGPSEAADRRHVEEVLREALSSSAALAGALTTAYQPIFDLADGRLTGFEALARLSDEGGAWLEPDDFIAVADDEGLIDELGALVLDRSMQDLAAWRARQSHEAWPAEVTISVNLSARQARSDELAQQVFAALERHRLAPADLTLEVSESVLRSSTTPLRSLTELRGAGVRIAVGDFATGYASLRHLATLPVDIVKIDRSVTADLATDVASAAIIGAVASLTRGSHFTCVVEGIETHDQLRALPGGLHGQGYLLGHPVSRMAAAGPASHTVRSLLALAST